MESGAQSILSLMKLFHFGNHLVTIVALVTLAGCQYFQGSVLPFIREVTKVKMPGHITTISEFDNGEWIAGGKYIIKEEDLKAFLAENAFQPMDQLHRYWSHFNTISKEDHIPVSDSLHLKYISGCREGNSYLFIVNENNGELWLEVQYPDWGGTRPCD